MADGAALVGAESFDLTHVVVTPDCPRPDLTAVQFHAAASAYLDGNPIGTFESLSLDEATTLDGRSAQVTVSAIWRPPVVTAFILTVCASTPPRSRAPCSEAARLTGP